MKVTVHGRQVSLTKRDFVSQGGEGSIYAKTAVAYKIYSDPKRAIPKGKVQELSVLDMPNIIKPEHAVLDTKGRAIGYSMRYVRKTFPLISVFPKSFRDRNGLTPDLALGLVRRLQETIWHIHQHGILVVDLNEFNFLVSQDFSEVYFIDVDSWQTPSFPATAIMDSVRDWHASSFSELTDWFSFAVVAFETFIGIHPYKGRHPRYAKRDGFVLRMKDNVSVFNRDVSVPKACLPFDVIPSVYQDWFKAVFEDGKRVAPPTDLQAVLKVVSQIRQIVGTDNFVIDQIGEFSGDIAVVVQHHDIRVVLTTNGLYLGRSAYGDFGRVEAIGFSQGLNRPVVASIVNDAVQLTDVMTRQAIPIDLFATDLLHYDGRIYAKSEGHIIELQVRNVGNGLVATQRIVGNCLQNATRCYDGVVLQNMLGTYYASLFPEADTCHQVRLDVLDGYKIVEAKYDSGVLMVVGVQGGKYDRFVFRFSTDFQTHDVRKIEDVTYCGLNFVVLDKGICVCIDEDERVELFRNNASSHGVKIIDDPGITGDMRLFKDGSVVLFAQATKLYSLEMK